MKTCTVEGCGREVIAKGLCTKHYDQARNSTPEGKEKKRAYASTESGRDTLRRAGRKFRAKWREDPVNQAKNNKSTRAWYATMHGRNLTYLRKYGVTFEWVLEVLAAQGGKCAMCDSPIEKFGRKWGEGCLDHCHETGDIRGVLCGGCNTALGFFEKHRDNATRYLAREPALKKS